MLKHLRNLFIGDSEPEVLLERFIGLSTPSKKAVAKREKAVKDAINKLGDRYMNVSLRKKEPVPELHIVKDRKSA